MKKFTALFRDSMEEFKHVNTVTVMAMFAAISVVLGYFTLVLGDYLKIGFSTIANQFVYYLFGPVAGGLFGGALDTPFTRPEPFSLVSPSAPWWAVFFTAVFSISVRSVFGGCWRQN